MPPLDNVLVLQTKILYLSRLLAVIAKQFPDNEIRIHKSLLDEVAGSDGKRALFEDFDEKNEQVVLTYRAKSIATYLVEGVPASTTQPVTMPQMTPSPGIHSRMPLTDEQIASLQQKLARESQYRAIKREPQPSSNT